MIGQTIAAALDPVIFARHVLKIEPDPWQQRVLRSSSTRVLLNCSRQAGKSLTTAIKATHTAFYQPGTMTLVFSPTQRQSGELFRKIVGILDEVLSELAYEEDTKTSLTLKTGSRIVSLPGNERTVRGFSAPALVLIDEAARIDDELMSAVMPMLATSNGAMMMLSTPWGKRGVFYERWSTGGDTWERIEVPATMCPRIPADFIEERRREMSPLRFQSEFMCQFTDTELSVFAADDIDAAVSTKVTPLFERSVA